MCGRYTYYGAAEIISQYEFLPKDDPQQKLALKVKDNYNVAPGMEMPVILRGEQEHSLELMEWGLVPSRSKDRHPKPKLINARQEGLSEKPFWKRLISSNRCVVPARGFYEWQKAEGGKGKQPFYITPAKGVAFSFAGLWDEWQGPGGEPLRTFTIITTSPNGKMADIHDRMPAILTDEQMDIWLSPGKLDDSLLHELLQPVAGSAIKLAKVSTGVNNVRNNSKDLIYSLED